jgi:chaperone required for assembly of F1-ATPase
MRDVFEEMFREEPADPMEAARRAMRAPLRRRFYRAAAVREGAGGFHVLLDDRPAKTPAGRHLAAPVRALAQAISAEWESQSEVVDPARMPLTRLANSILDGVADAVAKVAEETARYLNSDLVFYRAAGPEGLVARQAQYWDPVLLWAREEFGARFILSEGVTFVEQPAEAVAAAKTAIPEDPWRLGALHVATTLTGSGLIALALAAGRLTPEEAWAAAHVDEDWNMDVWGRDELAMQRRAARWAEMAAATTVLRLLA